MSELKVHDPSVASIQRHPGQKGYWRIHKDGTEEFVEDKPMTNPKEETPEEYQIRRANIYRAIKERQERKSEELSKKKTRNPRKKERELLKPERPGNYQKIMKEIDEKPNEWRFRLIPPGKLHEDSFRSIEITRGVRAITGCRKGFWSGSRCDKGVEIQALRLAKSVFKTKESAAKWIAAHTMTKY